MLKSLEYQQIAVVVLYYSLVLLVVSSLFKLSEIIT